MTEDRTGAGGATPAPASPTTVKESKDAMRITKKPLELEPGDRVTNPYDDREVVVTAPPVRCDDRVSVDYEFPPVLSPGGVGVMAVDIHAELEVSTTPRQDAIAGLRELADFLESAGGPPGGDDATPRGRQLIAALALAGLLAEQDLPTLSWTVSNVDPGRLTGQIHDQGAAASALRDWATFLDAAVVTTFEGGSVRHEARGSYRGALVLVVYNEPEEVTR